MVGKTSHNTDDDRKLLLHGAITLVATTFVAATIVAPVTAKRFVPPKDCLVTDDNGRKWPCARGLDHTATVTNFSCPVENRLGAKISFYCHEEIFDFDVVPGETAAQVYESVEDPAPGSDPEVRQRTNPKVNCDWQCAGNTMDDVVVWDEQWAEAWSCRTDGGGGQCRLVFESNREVVLVTRAGRRVLGDVAIKDCSKKWGGYGRWLPFGFGCTYPKKNHEYYGTIGWLGAGRGS